MSGEATAWLKANRCVDCKNRHQSACVYRVSKTKVGWRCAGYKKEWTIQWLR